MGVETSKEMIESRWFPRLEAKNIVSYKYLDDHTTKIVEGDGVSKNLSLGGILFEIDKEMTLGSQLLIKIVVGNHVIMTAIEVVRSRQLSESSKYDVGAYFLDIKRSDLDILANYFRDKGVDMNEYY